MANKTAFIADMKKLGFYENGENSLEIRNRDVAHDNDCSDDERDDSFYDEWAEKFKRWASPKVKATRELAKTHGVTIAIEGVGEYGLLMVEIK